MTGRPAKAWYAWGFLWVAMFVATPAIPSGAATNGSEAPGLLLNLAHVSTDTDKVIGNVGGVLVVGTFNTATARLVVEPRGTRPRAKFLSGKLSCATGSCSIDGELLGTPLAGLTLDAKFVGPFKNSNGYSTLTRLFGSLGRLYSDHDAWVSAVTKWTEAHVGVAEAAARVVAQAAGPGATDESSDTGSPAAAVDPPNGPSGTGGDGNGGGTSGSGGASGSGNSGSHGGGTTGGNGGGGAGGSGNHGGGAGNGGGPHR